MKEVWLIINDYIPESGDGIIGCFDTYDHAKEVFDGFSTDNNEYGEIQDTESWDIVSLSVRTK